MDCFRGELSTAGAEQENCNDSDTKQWLHPHPMYTCECWPSIKPYVCDVVTPSPRENKTQVANAGLMLDQRHDAGPTSNQYYIPLCWD